MLSQMPCTFSGIDPSALKNSRSLFERPDPPAVTTVPVRFVIMRDLRQWDYTFCVFRDPVEVRHAFITEPASIRARMSLLPKLRLCRTLNFVILFGDVIATN